MLGIFFKREGVTKGDEVGVFLCQRFRREWRCGGWGLFYLAAITASALLHGVHRATGARRKMREAFVEELLADIEILPFDLAVARQHAELWAKLQKRGEVIGPHDMMIAANCLALKHEVATLNVVEFQRVRGLKLAKVADYGG